jgi:hypothetical protein
LFKQWKKSNLDERLRVEEEEDYLQRVTIRPEEYTQENYVEKLYHFGTMTLVYKTDIPIRLNNYPRPTSSVTK